MENLDTKKDQADAEERERDDDVKYVLEDIDDLNRNIQEIEGKTEDAKTDRLKVCRVFFSFISMVLARIFYSTIALCC